MNLLIIYLKFQFGSKNFSIGQQNIFEVYLLDWKSGNQFPKFKKAL